MALECFVLVGRDVLWLTRAERVFPVMAEAGDTWSQS